MRPTVEQIENSPTHTAVYAGTADSQVYPVGAHQPVIELMSQCGKVRYYCIKWVSHARLDKKVCNVPAGRFKSVFPVVTATATAYAASGDIKSTDITLEKSSAPVEWANSHPVAESCKDLAQYRYIPETF